MRYKLIHIIVFLYALLFSQKYQLNSVSAISKSNGIIISLKTNILPNKNNISGWQANSGWFYLTLYEASLNDTTELIKTLDKDIIDLQIIDIEESLQIGLKLKKPIENYNFEFIEDKNKIIASLHYSTEYFAKIEPKNSSDYSQKKESISNGLKTWLNLTGAGLVISGALDKKETSRNTKSNSGLIILTFNLILNIIIEDY